MTKESQRVSNDPLEHFFITSLSMYKVVGVFGISVACSRLLERCAKESARGRKREGMAGISVTWLACLASLGYTKQANYTKYQRSERLCTC